MRTVEERLDSAQADIRTRVAEMPAKSADDIRRRLRLRRMTALVASGVAVAAVIVGTTMLLPADNQDLAGSTPTPNPPTTGGPASTTTTSLSSENQRELERLLAEQRAIEIQRAIESGREDVEPITGYGDFSDFEYFYVDWYEVTRLEIQCLRDQGFAVEAIPPGDGIDFSYVPDVDHPAAERTLWACQAGLNLPDYVEPTNEQLAEHYNYLLEVRQCVEAEGYETTEPPLLETYIDTGGLWSPYDLVANDDTIGIQEWYALNEACPQRPESR
ncbi:MAG TPA: hypothetical protein VE569_01065 [Acidimicrobiia bacterium]|nr:hypothetical protein [Acidimicrobiia bacterium]